MTLNASGQISLPESSILWDVIGEHMEEASFLSVQWERALVSPRFTAREVAERVERRLLAHVDGLVIGGEPVAERTLLPALCDGKGSEVFAASLALLGSDMGAYVEPVFGAWPAAKPEQAAAIQRALCLSDGKQVGSRLRAWLGAEQPERRALALEVLAFQRAELRKEIGQALREHDPVLQRAGLMAAARSGPAAWRDQVRPYLWSSEVELEAAALEAGAIAGMSEAWRRSRELVREGDAPEIALVLLAIAGEPADCELLIAAADARKMQISALFALGFTGSVEAVDACVRWAHDHKLAALAGEAIVAITGVDLEKEKLLAPVTDEDEPALEQDDLTADLGHQPEKELPIPDPAALAAWWHGRRREYKAGTRYVMGKPAEPAGLQGALPGAAMRRVHGMALELAVRTRGGTMVETRGWARRLSPELRQLQSEGRG